MTRTCLLPTVLGLFSSVVLSSGQVLSIDVGNVSLNPGQANQTFDLFVNNSGPDLDVTGLQLNLQITVPNGQSTTRPVITAVDILTGTVFSGDNLGIFGGKVNDYKWEIGTVADFNPPDPKLSGSHPEKVARITFNTTGVQPGTWTLSLTTGAGPTTYADASGTPMTLTLNDGTLTVVPEPSTYALVAGVGCLACGAYARRSRAKAAA